jgi:DNA-binding response OmpR family regulator
LTGKEYSIVELLSLRKGTTVTKKMLVAHLYGGLEEPERKIIDVFAAICAKSSPRRSAAIIPSKRCGGAAISFATRQQQRPPANARDDAVGSLHVGSHR